MKTPSRLFAVIVLFALAVACAWYLQRPAAAQEKKKENAPAAAVTKWEYRIVSMERGGEKDAEKELNKLGEEGFEIAFVTGSHRSQSDGARNGAVAQATPVFQYTLKRAKQ